MVFGSPEDDTDGTEGLVQFLSQQRFDKILSVAFTHFDRLDAAERFAVRLIVASQLQVWTLEQIVRLSGNMSGTKDVIKTLETKGWVVPVDKALLQDEALLCYRIGSKAYSQAVEIIVLQSQVDEVRQRKEQLGISDTKLKAGTTSVYRCVAPSSVTSRR